MGTPNVAPINAQRRQDKEDLTHWNKMLKVRKIVEPNYELFQKLCCVYRHLMVPNIFIYVVYVIHCFRKD